MSILPPYSRREDAQMQGSLKFSGLRNNLEEIITCFLQKLPKKSNNFIRYAFLSWHIELF